MDEQLGDLEFDLGNLRVVLDNVYDSPDRKKHDEEFRIKMLINVVGRLQEEAPRTGDDELKGAIAQVGSGFEDLKTAVGDQFVVAQDEHYDNFSSIHYRTPRLTGGTPAAPEAYGAIDSLNDDRQGAADVVDSLRGSSPSD